MTRVMDDSKKPNETNDMMIKLDSNFENMALQNQPPIVKQWRQKPINKCDRGRDILAPCLIDFLFGIQTNYKDYGFMDSMSPNPVQHVLGGLLKHLRLQQIDNDDVIDENTSSVLYLGTGENVVHADHIESSIF